MENLTAKGLEYEEDGEKKLIPRANVQDGYVYTLEQNEKKEHLMFLCIQRFGEKIDKMTIEIMVDWWLNHPEDMIKEMKNDSEYMSKFKSS